MNSDAAEAALGLLRLSPLNNANTPLLRKPSPSSLPLPPPPTTASTTTPITSTTTVTASTTATTTPTRPAQSISPPLPDADAISCICGFLFDDGFSIACDICSRWCHAACFDIVEGEVPEEWRCWDCDPRPVDRDRAVRIQKQRVAELHAREREKEKDKEKDKDKGRKRERAGSPVQRRRASAAAIEGSGNAKKKRRASIISPSTALPALNNLTHLNPSHQGEDEPVDIDEPWSLSYVPINKDIVTPEAHIRLRRQAQAWRGVTALSPPPTNSHHTQIHPVPPTPSPSQLHSNPLVRPPTYSLHTTVPVPSSSYIAPFTCAITPSASYLADPLNAYAHLGMPKPFVHLMGPPLDVALDARVVGDEGRFARNGCRPNAVLRPVLCSKAKEGREKERDRREGAKSDAEERDKIDEDDDTLTFGVFALRDLKANEEVVLGWEWDDGNAVHSLPALIESPHMFSTHHLTHLRAQMTSILHALSSTFTTCACGASTRDCVLNVMAQFVDGELDAAGGARVMNGARSEQAVNGVDFGITNEIGTSPAGMVDVCDASSSDKENWGHGHAGGVGLGIQMNANGGVSNNTNNGLNKTVTSPTTLPSTLITPRRTVDLGPLIGAKRGFRTREKVPFGGGVGGVEMVPSASVGVPNFGVGSSSGGSPSTGSRAWPTAAGPSSLESNEDPPNDRSSRTGTSTTMTSGMTVRKHDRKGKGRATEEIDVDVHVEGDAPKSDAMDVDEEKIPPRMRKRWMHAVSTSSSVPAAHVRDRNGRVSLLDGRSPLGSRGQSPPVSSGRSPPAPVSDITDWRSPASLSADSPAPMSGDSLSPPSPESTVDGMDVDVNDIRQMPPPPMPAALDPTTISSIAFASASPSATFSKLSLLSPVLPDMRSGSPSLFGMPVPNSVRRSVPISSPPPYKSSNKSPSDASTTQVIVHPPLSPNSMARSSSPPYRVRFGDAFQGQPSLKTAQHVPRKSAGELTPPPPTLPPVENDKTSLTSGSTMDVVPPSIRSPIPDREHHGSTASPGPVDVTPAHACMSSSTPPASPMGEATSSPCASPSPLHELTREPSPPPPKVKMSLKDFALRKKKQREEMAKEQVRECESPVVPGMELPEDSGDEGMHVDEDGQYCADEGNVERKVKDGEGNEQERGMSAKKAVATDIQEAEDAVMDDMPLALNGVRDELIASSTPQNGIMPEGLPAESRRRCHPEPRRIPPTRPRSPVSSITCVKHVDKLQFNRQSADSSSLKTKIEALEAPIPRGLVGADDRTSPFAPDPPPPPLHKGTERKASPKTYMSPLPPSAPASHVRPSHEDGEITSTSPKSSHFFPRSYTPPTQPRSFQTSHPSSPHFTHASSSSSSTSWRGPPPPPPIRPSLSSTNTPSSAGPSRPLPSGPRALRVNSQTFHSHTYPPSGRVYSGSQYIPRGPSADRERHERLDWDRERGWGPGQPRSRGRTGSSGWGR